MYQNDFEKIFKPVPVDGQYTHHCFCQIKHALFSHTHSKVLFQLSQAAQVTSIEFKGKHGNRIEELNKVIKYI